ncbi:MAG: hypothetical protein AAFW65_07150 [Pseudomonadota bacterium]
MKFKRWRVSAPIRDVNVGCALCLSFLIAACGGGSDEGQNSTPAAPEQAAPANELPAVWSTRSLEGPVVDMAASHGASPVLAIAYERDGLQFFNFNAERIAAPAPYDVKALADGHPATVAGADMMIFPGLGADNTLKAYLFGDGLLAPVEVALPVEANNVAGLCSGATGFGDEDLFQVAYWTREASSELKTGRVSVVDEDFVWTDTGSTPSQAPIGACRFEAEGVSTTSDAVVDAAMLRRGDYEARVTIGIEGELFVTEPGDEPVRYSVRDGLSVRAPEEPTAIVAVGQPLGGGYPGGVIIVSGEVAPDDYQAVFIDPSLLTLDKD